jgi:hypothetical protein
MVKILPIMVNFLTRLAEVARRKSDEASGKTVGEFGSSRGGGARVREDATGVSLHEPSL